MAFIKPIPYCKFWKVCPIFRRSECNDDAMNVEGCDEYKKLEKEGE